jgi:DNA adenine methylase
MSNIEIPKFVKWAGGKGQLLDQLEPLFPKKIERYIEPFVGSGAVFFFIVQKYKPKEIVLADVNTELITTYQIIQNDVERLIIELRQHEEYHRVIGKKYYLDIRSANPSKLKPLEVAARFIYLNKTCFNGLYRVNSKGQFNVPMGSYKNPSILQEDKLRFASKLLQGVVIKLLSFEKVLEYAKKGDFVYLDPPYYPLKKTSSFTSYTKENFLEKEQHNLQKTFDDLTKKGCKVMESNSDTTFIRKLYADYTTRTVKANRMINSKASQRGKINEVVIVNY